MPRPRSPAVCAGHWQGHTNLNPGQDTREQATKRAHERRHESTQEAIGRALRSLLLFGNGCRSLLALLLDSARLFFVGIRENLATNGPECRTDHHHTRDSHSATKREPRRARKATTPLPGAALEAPTAATAAHQRGISAASGHELRCAGGPGNAQPKQWCAFTCPCPTARCSHSPPCNRAGASSLVF